MCMRQPSGQCQPDQNLDPDPTKPRQIFQLLKIQGYEGPGG